MLAEFTFKGINSWQWAASRLLWPTPHAKQWNLVVLSIKYIYIVRHCQFEKVVI